MMTNMKKERNQVRDVGSELKCEMTRGGGEQREDTWAI